MRIIRVRGTFSFSFPYQPQKARFLRGFSQPPPPFFMRFSKSREGPKKENPRRRRLI